MKQLVYKFFSAQKAIHDYQYGQKHWTGGAIIVACDEGGYQAIPGAYLTDASYTGSRQAVPVAVVQQEAEIERPKSASIK